MSRIPISPQKIEAFLQKVVHGNRREACDVSFRLSKLDHMTTWPPPNLLPLDASTLVAVRIYQLSKEVRPRRQYERVSERILGYEHVHRDSLVVPQRQQDIVHARLKGVILLMFSLALVGVDGVTSEVCVGPDGGGETFSMELDRCLDNIVGSLHKPPLIDVALEQLCNRGLELAVEVAEVDDSVVDLLGKAINLGLGGRDALVAFFGLWLDDHGARMLRHSIRVEPEVTRLGVLCLDGSGTVLYGIDLELEWRCKARINPDLLDLFTFVLVATISRGLAVISSRRDLRSWGKVCEHAIWMPSRSRVV